MPDDQRAEALSLLLGFLDDEPFTQRIARLEFALEGKVAEQVPELLAAHAVGEGLLHAALLTRASLGRINDLIHAAAISLALPHLLAPGEVLSRPSLAAGNDSSRPFDVETDRRVAEFKLSRWRGSDAARKRQVFKDLVHLSADQSGRSAELYVLGSQPAHFLRTTRSPATWGLDKFPTSRTLFTERFGSLDVPISEFVLGPGNRVEIVDLEKRLPDIFLALP